MACPGVLWAFVVSTCLGSSMTQTVTQPQPEVSVQEAETVTLACTYDTSDSQYSLFWYKQPPSREMIFIIRQDVYNKKNATDNRFSVNFRKETKSISLRISDSQLEDTAMYFCALRCNAGNQRLYFGRGTSLTVIPIISDPDPSVYQMRSPESNNVSVCLFTDFDSETIVPQDEESTVHGTNSTSLHMKSMGSKSNGALRWSTSPDFRCADTFKENFYSSSDFPCDATLVEKSFETDMNLNLQNLSVIGFRILLLKVAGFNLLMTLRLWSS
ncbi:T cell receptor alpha chain MC.7.G5-like [Molossus molossus]|uniref:T cell receptor alpha chain MC.7.G5-like n=1 Tax=Molossus molossus TaxID=27622 RepID=UPI0017461672|nr:T cell receptor alpha chain MC.7.G5-like [Molossus molossus]